MAVLGRNFIVKLKQTTATGDPVAIVGQRNGTISITADVVDTTVKGSGLGTPLAKENMINTYGWEVTLSGAYDMSDTHNAMSYLIAGTEVTVECEIGIDNTSESDVLKGDGWITSVSSNGDQGDLATYDITITGSGALTVTN